MKATFNERPARFNINHRKEKNFYMQYSGLVWDGEKIREAVTLRLYSTDARSYCCVWIGNNHDFHTSGSGYAGGYGYHRGSAAAAEAIEAAGYDLDEDIAGRGRSMVREAVEAIAESLYPGSPVCVLEANA